MNEDNQRKALHITEKAKNNTFENCDIQGAKIEGKGTRMINSRIFNEFIKKHPTAFKSIIIGVVIGLIVLFIEYGFFN